LAKRPAKEKKLTIFVPEGFTGFECAMCGQCCDEPPRITISSAKCERLVRILQESGFRFPVRDAVMRDEDAPEGAASFALVGEKCVFLTPEGHCHLCDIGVPELRGLWCISFPVSPIITPRGVNYAVSFACPKTAEMLRARKPLNMLALTVTGAQPPSAGRPFSSKHRIPTVRGRPKLDWPAHRLVEGMLLAIARDWSINITDRLVVMPIMLNHLLRDYAGPQSDAALRERVSHAGRRLGEMIKTARSFRPDREVHYEALAGIFGRRIGLRTRTQLRTLVDRAMRQVRQRRTATKGAELGAALGHLYAKRYKPRASRFEHVLGNYIVCRIFANREMLTGGVYKGVYVVACLVALIRFVATTTAAERDVMVNTDILVEAVRAVEKLFGQSRNIFDFLDADAEQERMPDPACLAALVRI